MKRAVAALLFLILASVSTFYGQTVPARNKGARQQSRTQPAELSEKERNKRDGWRMAVDADESNLVYYNRNRISRLSPTITRAWFKIYTKAGVTLDHHEFNCDTREHRTIYSAQYRRNGTFLKEYNDPYALWSPIVPDTAGETLFEITCEGKDGLEDLLEKTGQGLARLYSDLGERYERQGKYREALRAYENALKQDPPNALYQQAVNRIKALIENPRPAPPEPGDPPEFPKP